jgi:hypothetical protein
MRKWRKILSQKEIELNKKIIRINARKKRIRLNYVYSDSFEQLNPEE